MDPMFPVYEYLRGEGAGGSVIALCGLSGTGKGTTVAILSQKLSVDQGWWYVGRTATFSVV